MLPREEFRLAHSHEEHMMKVNGLFALTVLMIALSGAGCGKEETPVEKAVEGTKDATDNAVEGTKDAIDNAAEGIKAETDGK